MGVPTLFHGNTQVTSPKDKASVLNEHCSSVFTNENFTSFPDIQDSGIPDLPDIIINSEGVEKLLNNINPNKASGPDAVPAKILQECAVSIAPVLTKIFQKSLDTGSVPSVWRDANVTPLYKKCDRSTASNYRPVWLTSIPCKILEHIIHHHVLNHFDRFNVLANVQHGFRRGRS